MSTEISSTHDLSRFQWHTGLPENDYLSVFYRIDSLLDGETTALGIAKEQSAVTLSLPQTKLPADLDDYTARIRGIRELGPGETQVPPYFLNTTVYTSRALRKHPRRFEIEIAYPLNLFPPRLGLVWNTIFGEVPRLGFITGFRILDIQFPPAFVKAFPGPSHGTAGIRQKLGVYDRPIFCRSMRPAVGLDTETMLIINRQVLSGGFDVIKDDELTYDTARSPFRERVRKMVEMKQDVEQRTGRKKLYFANVIDDHIESMALAEQAAELGADGVLVSHAIQGLSILREVARGFGLLIISHNTGADFMTRHPGWGVDAGVMAKIQRLGGADIIMTPGDAATQYEETDALKSLMEACRNPLGEHKQVMPVFMGGKTPMDIEHCRAACGSDDFMVIAASWLDNHEDGLAVAASAYLDAL